MTRERERLTANAEAFEIADAKRERWWNRAPFLLSVTVIMIALIGDVFVLNYRVVQIEKLSTTYEKDNFPEIIRSNKAYVDTLKSDRQVGILEQLHSQRRRINALEGHPENE